ncbi:hypothetical protein CEXT_256311 [Caerostris extrusa]|uniref:Uncharacterized protein n=1 Tax=Caerostris extrusa TaxID=172846 RepID=A0AAV4M5M4_CAEEX|nr:hypothetical protein CEXT_256311 [Caerostris extrusa]
MLCADSPRLGSYCTCEKFGKHHFLSKVDAVLVGCLSPLSCWLTVERFIQELKKNLCGVVIHGAVVFCGCLNELRGGEAAVAPQCSPGSRLLFLTISRPASKLLPCPTRGRLCVHVLHPCTSAVSIFEAIILNFKDRSQVGVAPGVGTCPPTQAICFVFLTQREVSKLSDE